jgi:serine/threonine-protein kinase
MSPQQSIAHYRIVSKLGEGGMGAVYRATDTKLNRDVAIKLLPGELASDSDRLARFSREAQVLASLNHPNIAAIYGVEQGAIVMELVEGQELRGPVPLDTALDYARQIAAGLEAAHEKGIVHRDLKPANVKVTADGIVKLLDFGLAKASDAAATTGTSPTMSPTLSLAMTQAGMILGTAAYMSPEQARGRPIDRRADIWAFGVVVYELITGSTLFGGDTITDVLASVVKQQPDFAKVPPKVRRLLNACLEKEPKQRLQAIGDWRLLLDESAAVPAQATERRTATRIAAWAITGILMMALVALALVHFRETPPEVPILRTTLVPPEGVTLDFTDGLGLPALSPDGRKLVFGARTGDGKVPLWVRSLVP